MSRRNFIRGSRPVVSAMSWRRCLRRSSRKVSTHACALTDAVRLQTPFAPERVRVALATLPGSKVAAYLVDHPPFYDRPGGPYGAPDGREWPDNHRRFALLAWVAAALGTGADPNWRPDFVHGHDWHAGLAPAYLRAEQEEGGSSAA